MFDYVSDNRIFLNSCGLFSCEIHFAQITMYIHVIVQLRKPSCYLITCFTEESAQFWKNLENKNKFHMVISTDPILWMGPSKNYCDDIPH